MMLETSRILVRRLAHAGLAVLACSLSLALTGCGQTGPLYLPTEPAAANRASLPQSLWPVMPHKQVPAPAGAASRPAPAPANAPAPATAPASP